MNPKTGETAAATRGRVRKEYDLAMKDEYSHSIEKMVEAATPAVE